MTDYLPKKREKAPTPISCPFCGRKPPKRNMELMYTRMDYGAGLAIVCRECGATGPSSSLRQDQPGVLADAIRAWNRRLPLSEGEG